MKRAFLRFVLGGAALAFLAHAPQVASGASRLPPGASPRVHPQVDLLFAHRARTGRTLPVFRPNAAFEQTGRLPVAVRFATPPDVQKRRRLEASGVKFDKDVPTASGAWLVTIDESGLRTLRADPELARVSVDLFHASPLPVEGSLEETRAAVAKRAVIAKDGVPLDGKGTVIADIDTPVYLHHPAFFRADGGAFPWVDVDGDGKLTPGKDGVDLDQSGTIEPSEVLRELRSTGVTAYDNQPFLEHDDFQPDIDYLFLDTNGNGERDHGKDFDESTPAYGEPLFVFDDANHDGKTSSSERLLRLKTSKFRTIVEGTKTYERGKSGATGLGHYPAETDAKLASDMGHGTGVAGILVGGQPGLSRWTGFAPDADLILYDGYVAQRGPISGVDWAIDQRADVVLTEFAPYTDVSLDGSSEIEAMLDAAFDKGVVPVSPAGNLAASYKHRTITLEPGKQAISLYTKSPVHWGSFSIHHGGPDRTLALTLKTPERTIPISNADTDTVEIDATSAVYVTNQTTPRGTHERFINYYSTDAALPTEYSLEITLDAGAPLDVDIFASDDVSDWYGGLSFRENTEARTICSPSTSDKTISVAAYVLHGEEEYGAAGKEGERAYYSSSGPTLGGSAGIDIAAPDNPMSASPPVDGLDGVPWTPFGGTSGAGPHVAGAVALLAQAYPKESANERKKRILDSARAFDGESEKTVGKGKLDVAAALEATVPSGDAPVPAITVVTPPAAGGEATLTVAAADDESEGALTARWDLDYDGTFDTEWLPLGDAGKQTVSFADAAVGAAIGVKVEVRDAQGNLNGATTILVAGEPKPAEVDSGNGAPADDVGCACRTTGGATRSGGRLGETSALFAMGALLALRSRRRRRS